MPSEGLSTEDIAERSGLSTRRVMLYAREGAFGVENVKPGSGRHRQFTREHVLIAAVLNTLGTMGGILGGQPSALSRDLALDVANVLSGEAAKFSPSKPWLVVDTAGNVSVESGASMSGFGVLVLDLVALGRHLDCEAA